METRYAPVLVACPDCGLKYNPEQTGSVCPHRSLRETEYLRRLREERQKGKS